ncbi:MAG: toprim domain-containing protein [Pseudomonadota bacterium]
MTSRASDLARRLARQAEAVCRHYLPAGRREGAYWRVGDVANAAGQSLYVRLAGPKAGKWADAATGEHGDLLDLIAANQKLDRFSEVLDEARGFLAVPSPVTAPSPAAPTGSPEAARRLFTAGRPLRGTPAERYLRARGLTRLRSSRWLRYHPHCFHRAQDGDSAWPALLAAVTDLTGSVQGLQRLWLTRSGGKAPLADPRKAMGHLLGHAVRFGEATEVLAAGEGLESVLSIREPLPWMPAAAALSAAHLAALRLPASVRRLYVIVDDDPAGRRAAGRLAERAQAAGVEPAALRPVLGDLNEDLQQLGRDRLARTLRRQIAASDWRRFADD